MTTCPHLEEAQRAEETSMNADRSAGHPDGGQPGSCGGRRRLATGPWSLVAGGPASGGSGHDRRYVRPRRAVSDGGGVGVGPTGFMRRSPRGVGDLEDGVPAWASRWHVSGSIRVEGTATLTGLTCGTGALPSPVPQVSPA